MSQHTSHILMIRPAGFDYNNQTASTNAFQRSMEGKEDIQERVVREFNRMVRILRENDVNIITVDDLPEPHTPDAIFPNNWFSTHEEGIVVTYPMYAENRRWERRADILDMLSDQFQVDKTVDLTDAEKEDRFLEGTGSMVLDRESRICYACLSPRTDRLLLEQFCNKLGYELQAFHGTDAEGQAIYHTNVIMCIGEKFMLVCLDCIHDSYERSLVIQSTSKEIIPISMEQVLHFAGNMLEVVNTRGEHLLVMSTSAYESLLPKQVTQLERYARIVHAPIPTIETYGGGSARCMMAEIFLPPRSHDR